MTTIKNSTKVNRYYDHFFFKGEKWFEFYHASVVRRQEKDMYINYIGKTRMYGER